MWPNLQVLDQDRQVEDHGPHVIEDQQEDHLPRQAAEQVEYQGPGRQMTTRKIRLQKPWARTLGHGPDIAAANVPRDSYDTWVCWAGQPRGEQAEPWAQSGN